ncbi:hypothetical protein V498_09371, partial [Pseudogymnoascus sp. VKM F-4517 (FW-2822)]
HLGALIRLHARRLIALPDRQRRLERSQHLNPLVLTPERARRRRAPVVVEVQRHNHSAEQEIVLLQRSQPPHDLADAAPRLRLPVQRGLDAEQRHGGVDGRAPREGVPRVRARARDEAPVEDADRLLVQDLEVEALQDQGRGVQGGVVEGPEAEVWFYACARGADAGVPFHDCVDEAAFGEDGGHGGCFGGGAGRGKDGRAGAEFVVEDVARELRVAVARLDEAGEGELGGEDDVDLSDEEPDAATHLGFVGGDATELRGVAVVAHWGVRERRVQQPHPREALALRVGEERLEPLVERLVVQDLHEGVERVEEARDELLDLGARGEARA